MKTLSGKTLQTGIVVGQAFNLGSKSVGKKKHVENTLAECGRLEAALSELRIAMRRDFNIADKNTRVNLNEQLCLLSDDGYQDNMRRTIRRNKICAECAVVSCSNGRGMKVLNLERQTVYIHSENVNKAVSRLLDILAVGNSQADFTEPRILVGEDFSPAQLEVLNRDLILGLVAGKASLSPLVMGWVKTYEIPCISGVDISDIVNGVDLIMDGEQNRVVVGPDPFSLAFAKGKMEKAREEQAAKRAAALVETKKTEETKAEEPKAEEAKVEETKAEEPEVEEVKIVEEIKTEEPGVEEVKVEETKAEEPITEKIKQKEIQQEESRAEEVKLVVEKPKEAAPKADILVAPVDGWLLAMEDIPDESFANGFNGSCFGVEPYSGEICAPVSGKVIHVAENGHGVTLEVRAGIQVLVHIGLGTEELSGEVFKVMVAEGQQVQQGDLLVVADLDEINASDCSTITTVAIRRK